MLLVVAADGGTAADDVCSVSGGDGDGGGGGVGGARDTAIEFLHVGITIHDTIHL